MATKPSNRKSTARKSTGKRTKRARRPASRPSNVAHWTEIEGADDSHYQGDDELMSIGAAFGRHFGLARLGIHHERLVPGRRTSYPHAGTGICHSFLNNTAGEVHLLVVGEKSKPENRVFYPRNPEEARRGDWWNDPPQRVMGDHDGLTDKVRSRRVRAGKSRSR